MIFHYFNFSKFRRKSLDLLAVIRVSNSKTCFFLKNFRPAKFKLMEEHVIEFNQLAMTHAQGSDVMLNRVMTKGTMYLLIGLFVSTFAHFRLLWTILNHIGPLWPLFNSQRSKVLLTKMPFFAYFCPFFPTFVLYGPF